MYPKEFQTYENLLVSCNGKNTCGTHKENNYDEIFINPVIDNPVDYFEYNIANGEIVPKCNETDNREYKRARYTIDILNLNSYELKEGRRNFIDVLSVYKENYDEYDEYLQYFLDDRHNFPSLIRLYMNI